MNSNLFNTSVNGFDLSSLTEVKLAPPRGNEFFKNTDEVDVMIKNKVLANNPDMIDGIMERLDLHKFWAQINNHSEYHLFRFLAVDRMLNFHEAAESASFDIHEHRIGMVVAAMTASFKHAAKSYLPLTRNSLIPCFLSSKVLSLEDFDLKAMSREQVAIAESILGEFCRNTPIVKNLGNNNRIRVYLIDAMRMWVVSGSKELLDFMTGGKVRHEYLPDKVSNNINTYQTLGAGTITQYKASDMTIFNTVWGRTKSFHYNIPARVTRLFTTL